MGITVVITVAPGLVTGRGIDTADHTGTVHTVGISAGQAVTAEAGDSTPDTDVTNEQWAVGSRQ